MDLTLKGNKGVKLSGGQAQRISIARVIMRDADVFVFDETTSNLDNESEAIIIEALKKVKNKTVIIIAQRLQTLTNCKWLVGFRDGEIVEQGTRDDLLNDKNSMLYNLYNQPK